MQSVAPSGVASKSVDSSSVSQKPCPALGFEGSGCGKTEEGSGKKGSDFWGRESKKLPICQRTSFFPCVLNRQLPVGRPRVQRFSDCSTSLSLANSSRSALSMPFAISSICHWSRATNSPNSISWERHPATPPRSAPTRASTRRALAWSRRRAQGQCSWFSYCA